MKTYLDFSPSPKIVQAVGKITVEFAALEGLLPMCIGFLLSTTVKNEIPELGAKELGDLFTAEVSFRARVDIFSAPPCANMG